MLRHLLFLSPSPATPSIFIPSRHCPGGTAPCARHGRRVASPPSRRLLAHHIAFWRLASPYCSSHHSASHRNTSQRITAIQSTRLTPLCPAPARATFLCTESHQSHSFLFWPCGASACVENSTRQPHSVAALMSETSNYRALSALSVLALSSKTDPLLIYAAIAPVIARRPAPAPAHTTAIGQPLTSRCRWCPPWGADAYLVLCAGWRIRRSHG